MQECIICKHYSTLIVAWDTRNFQNTPQTIPPVLSPSDLCDTPLYNCSLHRLPCHCQPLVNGCTKAEIPDMTIHLQKQNVSLRMFCLHLAFLVGPPGSICKMFHPQVGNSHQELWNTCLFSYLGMKMKAKTQNDPSRQINGGCSGKIKI